MEERTLMIDTDFITLGQLLKTVDLISSGGMAKWYLEEFPVMINQVQDNRRGKKIYPGDQVEFPNDQLRVLITSPHMNED